MKLRPITKIEKRNAATSKKLTMTSCWYILTFMFFFSNLWAIWNNVKFKI